MPNIETAMIKINYNDSHDKGDFHQFYNTSRWRKLREYKLKINPVCERCNNKLGEQVHHIIPIATGMNNIERSNLCFNINNLMTLCVECHQKEHNH